VEAGGYFGSCELFLADHEFRENIDQRFALIAFVVDVDDICLDEVYHLVHSGCFFRFAEDEAVFHEDQQFIDVLKESGLVAER
jgi:hypothetical protein